MCQKVFLTIVTIVLTILGASMGFAAERVGQTLKVSPGSQVQTLGKTRVKITGGGGDAAIADCHCSSPEGGSCEIGHETGGPGIICYASDSGTSCTGGCKFTIKNSASPARQQ